jgi:ATP-dependent RNA helicase DeaD
VVLDEADEMLDLGFREDLEFILGAAPADRRTLMFSATVSRPIADLAKSYQRNAVRLATTAEKSQHVDIEYRALTVAQADRENAIINVLRYYEAPNALVFCSTRAAVNHLTARFNNRGFAVVAMSGELSQNERTHALQAMRDGRARVCIATDVAARGIDLPGLELVIHADTPTNRETLLHRSGRTGRAGRKGVSVLIVPQSGRKRVERLLGSANVSATWARPPSADEVLARDNERILQDPVFTEPLTEDEAPFVSEMLAKHSAEAIAAAYLRTFRTKNSAPEDLMEIAVTGAPAPTERKERREEFSESIWISLSVGRKQNAEPRWLIPMLCKAGNLNKSDIGQIKLQQDESLVQLEAQAGRRFVERLGSRTLERGITARAIEGTPDFGAPSGGYDKPRGPKPPHRGQGPKPEGNWAKPAGKKPYAKKEGGFDKPWGDKSADKGPKKAKPFGDKPHAPGGKKSKRKPD